LSNQWLNQWLNQWPNQWLNQWLNRWQKLEIFRDQYNLLINIWTWFYLFIKDILLACKQFSNLVINATNLTMLNNNKL